MTTLPIPTANADILRQLDIHDRDQLVHLAYEAAKRNNLLSVRINDHNRIIGAGMMPDYEYVHYNGPFKFYKPSDILSSIQI